MYPKKFLEQNSESIEKGLCFVIMPLTTESDYVYHNGIKPAVEAFGMRCVRADETYATGTIIDDILSVLQKAEIVIADLTGENPNVLYELGIAHAIKDKVIIISQSREDIPFDLHYTHCVFYNNTISGTKTFQLKLKQAVEFLSMPQPSIDTSVPTEHEFSFDVSHYRRLLSKTENELTLRALAAYLLNSAGFEVMAQRGDELQSLPSVDMVVWNDIKIPLLENPVIVKCKWGDVGTEAVGEVIMYLTATKLTGGFIFSTGKFTTSAMSEISKSSTKKIRIIPFDMMELRTISSGKDFIVMIEEKIREIVLRERAA